MKKLGKIALLALMLCLVLGSGAFASSEPSAEPSAEPAASSEPSAEPSAEPAVSSEPIVGSEIRDALSANRFDVSFLVNGEECETAAVEYTAEENVYTFRLSELLDTLGIEISYDEQTRVFTVVPTESGLMQMLSVMAADMPSAEEAAVASLDEFTPAQARDMPVGAFFKKPH